MDVRRQAVRVMTSIFESRSPFRRCSIDLLGAVLCALLTLIYSVILVPRAVGQEAENDVEDLASPTDPSASPYWSSFLRSARVRASATSTSSSGNP